MNAQCRQFNDIAIERIFDLNSKFSLFSFCAKKSAKRHLSFLMIFFSF